MRTIHETFEDKDFERLKKLKGNRSWRQFILELVSNKINQNEKRIKRTTST
jgi:predicted CopG family antitoxin